MTPELLTVGHSVNEMPHFLSLLEAHAVTAIADVRSTPFSRFAAWFNQDSLKLSLRERGVAYAFMGNQLGARARDPDCYVDGRVQYGRLAETAAFKEGIERLVRGAESQRIAVMCTEKDPLDCHRTILVARALVAQGVTVGHILADGSLEAHEEAMNRLLRQQGLDQPDLFRSADELLEDALIGQEAKIAYVDADLVESAEGA